MRYETASWNFFDGAFGREGLWMPILKNKVSELHSKQLRILVLQNGKGCLGTTKQKEIVMKIFVRIVVVALCISAISKIGYPQTSRSTEGSLLVAVANAQKSEGLAEIKKNSDGSSLMVAVNRGAVTGYQLKDSQGRATTLTPVQVAGSGFVALVTGGNKCFFCSMSGTTMNCMEIVCATAQVEFAKPN